MTPAIMPNGFRDGIGAIGGFFGIGTGALLLAGAFYWLRDTAQDDSGWRGDVARSLLGGADLAAPALLAFAVLAAVQTVISLNADALAVNDDFLRGSGFAAAAYIAALVTWAIVRPFWFRGAPDPTDSALPPAPVRPAKRIVPLPRFVWLALGMTVFYLVVFIAMISGLLVNASVEVDVIVFVNILAFLMVVPGLLASMSLFSIEREARRRQLTDALAFAPCEPMPFAMHDKRWRVLGRVDDLLLIEAGDRYAVRTPDYLMEYIDRDTTAPESIDALAGLLAYGGKAND